MSNKFQSNYFYVVSLIMSIQNLFDFRVVLPYSAWRGVKTTPPPLTGKLHIVKSRQTEDLPQNSIGPKFNFSHFLKILYFDPRYVDMIISSKKKHVFFVPKVSNIFNVQTSFSIVTKTVSVWWRHSITSAAKKKIFLSIMSSHSEF